jgi:hypothetical protein
MKVQSGEGCDGPGPIMCCHVACEESAAIVSSHLLQGGSLGLFIFCSSSFFFSFLKLT